VIVSYSHTWGVALANTGQKESLSKRRDSLVYGPFWHARPYCCGCARACVCAHYTIQPGTANGEAVRLH